MVFESIEMFDIKPDHSSKLLDWLRVWIKVSSYTMTKDWFLNLLFVNAIPV